MSRTPEELTGRYEEIYSVGNGDEENENGNCVTLQIVVRYDYTIWRVYVRRGDPMFFTIEKFEKRVEELEHRRYFGMRNIAPFAAMPGDLPEDSHYHGAPPERRMPEQDSREWKEFGLNDFFVGRDRYLWLDKELTLPPAMEG